MIGTTTSHQISYRGVGVAMVNGREFHGKQRQGGKLDFNLDFN